MSNENQRCCSFDIFVSGPDFDLCSQNVCQQGEICIPEIDRYFCYSGHTNIKIRNCSSTVIVRKPGADPVIAEWVVPIAFDHYGHILDHVNVPAVSPGTSLDLGEHDVVYTFTNGRRTASCNFKVIVAANTGPGFQNCPRDITIRSSKSTVLVDWLEPLLQANEDRSLITVTQTHSPGQSFPVPSVTTVSYSFTDDSGRSNTCSFEVSIEVAPQGIIVNQHSDKFFYVEQSAQNSVAWPRPYVYRIFNEHNPPLIVSPSRVQPDIRAGSASTHRYPKGVYPVTYNFTDLDGNTVATVEFIVAYYTTDQRTVPSLPCTGAPTILPVFSEMPVSTGWANPDVLGDEADLVWTELPAYRSNEDLFPVGVTNFKYLFYSPGSNTTHECHYQVSVVDNIAPRLIECPCDMTLTAPIGTGVLPVQFPSVVLAYDGSYGGITAAASSLQPPVSVVVGQSQLISYELVDSSGNLASCSFTIEVLIEEPPPIEPAVITNCIDRVLFTSEDFVVLPPDQWPMAVHETRPSGYMATISTLVFMVNSETFVSATFPNVQSMGIPFEGESSCLFTVLVLDDIPPVVNNCSQEIFATAKTGQNFVRVNWTEPRSVESLEGGELVTSTASPGDLFPVGETSVVWYTFNDDAGFQTNCSVNITVEKAPTDKCLNERQEPIETAEPFSFTSETIVVIVVTAIATFVFSLALFLMSLCCCTCCCVVDTSKQSAGNGSSIDEVQRTRLFVKIGGKNIPIYGPVTPLSNGDNVETGTERQIDDDESDYDFNGGAVFNSGYQNEQIHLPSLSERVRNDDYSYTVSHNNYIEHDVEPKSPLKPPIRGQRVIDEKAEKQLYGYDETPGTLRVRPELPPKPDKKKNGPPLLEKTAFHAMQEAVQTIKDEKAWKGRVIDDGELYGFDQPANV